MKGELPSQTLHTKKKKNALVWPPAEDSCPV